MMQPLTMNEFVQQNLNEVGFKVELEVLEWNTLINAWRAGAKDKSSRGAAAMNYSYFIQDPFTAFTRHVQSELVAPNGTNWGYYSDKDMDALLLKAKTTFDPAGAGEALQAVHREPCERCVVSRHHARREPARAMSPRSRGSSRRRTGFRI